MEIYLILLGIIIALAILIGYSKNNQKLRKKIFLIIIFILLFTCMALRDRSVGVDTDLYCRIFTNFVSGNVSNENFNTTKIYEYYNIFVGNIFGNNPRNIIIANSFVIVLLYCIFVKRASPNVYISTILYFLLYFYLQSFNIARQAMAMLLFAISITFLVKRKWKSYIIINTIAIFIHNTVAIPFIIGGVLGLIKEYNIKKVVKLLGIIGICSLFINFFIRIFIMIFPKYISYFTTHDIFYETGEGRKILLILVYMAFLILGLYVFYKKKKDILEEEYRKYMIYSTLIGIACIIGILGTTSILINRLGLYFEIFMIIYIPMIIENIGKNKDLWYLLTTILLFIPFYALLVGNNSGVVPYILYQ